MTDTNSNPMNFFQGMWKQMGFQLPGMVTPTLDEGELEKQINDLKSVENWLRMNLSMLQMTIQNLEMQKSAISTFRSMGEHFSAPPSAAGSGDVPFNTFFQKFAHTDDSASTNEPCPKPGHDESLSKATLWPWEMMSELNAKFKEQIARDNQSATPPESSTVDSTSKPAPTANTPKPATD